MSADGGGSLSRMLYSWHCPECGRRHPYVRPVRLLDGTLQIKCWSCQAVAVIEGGEWSP